MTEQQATDVNWYLTKGLNALTTAHKYRHTSVVLQELEEATITKAQAFALDEANEEHAAHWSRVIKNKARLEQATYLLNKTGSPLWFITLVGITPCSTLKRAMKRALTLARSIKTRHSGIICPEVRIMRGAGKRYEPHLHMIMSLPDNARADFRAYLKTFVQTGIKNPLRFSQINTQDLPKIANYCSKHSQTHSTSSDRKQPLSNTTFLAETAVLYELDIKSHQMLVPTGDLFWCPVKNMFKLGTLCRKQTLTLVKKMRASSVARIPIKYNKKGSESSTKNNKNVFTVVYPCFELGNYKSDGPDYTAYFNEAK